MSAVVALLGVGMGAIIGLLGGIALQVRADRRRMYGAAWLVASELRRNAGEVEHYFASEQLEREGSKAVLAMPVRVGSTAWQANATELMHLVEPDLRRNLLGIYAYLDRFGREPRLLRPTMPKWMREAAEQLEALAEPTWWERRVMRVTDGRRDVISSAE
jgi:hypothetical protein